DTGARSSSTPSSAAASASADTSPSSISTPVAPDSSSATAVAPSAPATTRWRTSHGPGSPARPRVTADGWGPDGYSGWTVNPSAVTFTSCRVNAASNSASEASGLPLSTTARTAASQSASVTAGKSAARGRVSLITRILAGDERTLPTRRSPAGSGHPAGNQP